MSELEKRLRELYFVGMETHDQDGVDVPAEYRGLMLAAARIGAELEREECAAEADKRHYMPHPEYAEAARHIARAIRARGAK